MLILLIKSVIILYNYSYSLWIIIHIQKQITIYFINNLIIDILATPPITSKL